MNKVDEIKKIKVVNWMREEVDGYIKIRTAKEAKEYFKLNVSERTINRWVESRGLSSSNIFKEAKEIKKKEITEWFLKTSSKRIELKEKALEILSDNSDLKDLDNDTLNVLRNFKRAIDELTGMNDLVELEKVDTRLRKLEQEIELNKLEVKEKKKELKKKEDITHVD